MAAPFGLGPRVARSHELRRCADSTEVRRRDGSADMTRGRAGTAGDSSRGVRVVEADACDSCDGDNDSGGAGEGGEGGGELSGVLTSPPRCAVSRASGGRRGEVIDSTSLADPHAERSATDT
jgi:hypothetical protein